MTPKEKAEELVKKLFEFNHRVKWDDFYNDWVHNYDQAKQCALIAVDEILSMGIMSDSGDWRMAKSYWLEVKQEIECL